MRDKVKKNIANLNYKKRHPDRVKEQDKNAYYKRREKILARKKAYRLENLEKIMKYQKQYQLDNKKERVRRDLKKVYGITEDDYNKMYITQNGKCAICGIHQNNLKRRLSVDHDHINGRVRGLLCHHCNTILGMAKDDSEILESALIYLKLNKI